METLTQIITQTWAMIAEMGPYLLLGFGISALLYRYLRESWVEGLMGQRKFSSILWGSVIGVPMPLCSCGVIPVTMSLHSKGASKGATVSFLTSTPQTGVDSFLATYGMLGPVFAAYKLVVAFLSGILVGTVTDLSTPAAEKAKSRQSNTSKAKSDAPPSFVASIRYAFYTMPGDLSNSLIVGFLLAGLIAALVPADLLSSIPGGAISAILLATLFSVPFYICSTGSIPLALALIHSGLPVSAALVLLIAGPATNVATITTMRKVLGGRTTIIYVGGVVICTWIAAAIYHFFLDNGTLGHHAMSHDMSLPWWKHLGGALLLAILLLPRLREFLLASSSRHAPPSTGAASPDDLNISTMPQHTLSIEGMNCSHCENSVRNGLESLPGATVVSVDRNACTAVVETDAFDEAAAREKITSLGFDYKGLK